MHLQRCLTSPIFWDTQTKSTMRHLTLIRWKNLKDWQYQVPVKMGETVTPVTATTETNSSHKMAQSFGKSLAVSYGLNQQSNYKVFLPKRNYKMCPQKIYTNDQSSFSNSPKMKTAQVSINRYITPVYS